MEIVKKIAAGMTIVMLAACSTPIADKAVIAPHHLLVEDYMTEFYSELEHERIDTVVILSPNHFGHGFSYIQTSSEVANVDLDKIEELEGLVVDEPANFDLDHGIFVHYPFIEDNFSGYEILPIIMKEGTSVERLEALVDYLTGLDRAFFIASIDFTHLEQEEIGLKNDEATIDYLEDWSEGELDADLEALIKLAKGYGEGIAIDSPESLYVLLRILEQKEARDFELWARTSSFTVTGIDEADLYTSHIFASFR